VTSVATIRRLEHELGEVVSRHEGTREDVARYAQYVQDPVGWAREVLGVRLWRKQRQIARGVLNHELVCVVACNSSGKDFWAAVEALRWAYAVRGLCVLTGPTERQTEQILMRHVSDMWERAGLPGTCRVRGVIAPGGGRIVAHTSVSVSKLTGYHHPRGVMCVLSEAQDLDDERGSFEAAFSNVVGERGRIVALGNPLFSSGRFHDFARSPEWHTVTISAFDTPNLRTGRELIPGMITRKGVDRIRANFPEVYEQRVLAKFPETDERGLLRRSWLDEAVARWESWSVLHVQGAKVVIDAVGLGGGVADRLRQLGWSVHDFNGGRAAKKRKLYANRRTEAYFCLARMLERGEVAVPKDRDLIAELMAQTWRLSAGGIAQLDSKDTIKSRVGRSPDKADAASMAFADSMQVAATWGTRRQEVNLSGLTREAKRAFLLGTT